MINFNQFQKNKKAWLIAEKATDEWFDYVEETFPYIVLGSTFTPEKCPDKALVLESLKYSVEVLGLRNIRFPLRWSGVYNNGVYSFDYYWKLLDYLFDCEGVEICLNIGPLKTADWPEFHVPLKIIESISPIPQWPHHIPPNHPLVEKAITYLQILLDELKTRYGEKLSAIKTIQLNNEAWNPFGSRKIISGVLNETNFYEVVASKLPQRNYLFNSAGLLQIREIIGLISKIGIQDRSILGIDYYYHTPFNDKKFLRRVDPFGYWIPSFYSINETVVMCEKKGLELEFTEVQMEKWGNVEYPGNSEKALKYVITRCSEFKPRHQSMLTLRLWGVENLIHEILIGKATDEHQKMKRLIQRINS